MLLAAFRFCRVSPGESGGVGLGLGFYLHPFDGEGGAGPHGAPSRARWAVSGWRRCELCRWRETRRPVPLQREALGPHRSPRRPEPSAATLRAHPGVRWRSLGLPLHWALRNTPSPVITVSQRVGWGWGERLMAGLLPAGTSPAHGPCWPDVHLPLPSSANFNFHFGTENVFLL